jgi:hypothetical protein
LLFPFLKETSQGIRNKKEQPRRDCSFINLYIAVYRRIKLLLL